jgi:hypothetical protein
MRKMITLAEYTNILQTGFVGNIAGGGLWVMLGGLISILFLMTIGCQI